MKYLPIPILVLFFVIALIACKKESESGQQKIAGTISCSVHVMHHSWGVPSIKLYLKRDATVFPGKDTSAYDLVRMTDTQGLATFDSLYPGSYYLYSKGFDMIWGDTVTGYRYLLLNDSSISNNSASTILYVSE